MPYLIIILFSIALVLSTVNAALFIWLKRRFDRKIALLIQMIDSAGNEITDVRHSVAEVEGNSAYHIQNLGESVNELKEKTSGLELDYQEAQKAANKVNDFVSALANIFDYDPILAMQRSREKGGS